jgi:hypothetical protein
VSPTPPRSKPRNKFQSVIGGGRTEPRSKNFAPKMSLDFGAPLFLTLFLTSFRHHIFDDNLIVSDFSTSYKIQHDNL